MMLGGRESLGATVVALGESARARLDQDRQLADAILRKDRKAAAEFVSVYSDPLYAYVRGRLAPRTDLVDDVVQEVFLAALSSLPRYAGESPLRSWLLGIARHKVEDYYRARLRQMDSLSEAGDDLAVIPVATLDFDGSLDRGKLQEKTRRILTQLPEQDSVVLLWRYWEKRSAREMASQTGKTEKAIERLLARARARFKKLWEAK